MSQQRYTIDIGAYLGLLISKEHSRFCNQGGLTAPLRRTIIAMNPYNDRWAVPTGPPRKRPRKHQSEAKLCRFTQTGNSSRGKHAPPSCAASYGLRNSTYHQRPFLIIPRAVATAVALAAGSGETFCDFIPSNFCSKLIHHRRQERTY